MERTRTVREAIREELLRGAATARELSERVSILEKSLRTRGERLVVEHAARLVPGCGSTRIDPPAFRIEAA